MDLKTIARYLNLVAAELRVITTGSVESRQIQTRAKGLGRVSIGRLSFWLPGGAE